MKEEGEKKMEKETLNIVKKTRIRGESKNKKTNETRNIKRLTH